MKWSISKIAKECRPCSKPFAEEDAVCSTVIIKESDEEGVIETERFDICMACWEKWDKKSNPFWKCIYREKKEEETAKLPDKDIVMALFYQKVSADTSLMEEAEKRENKVLSYLLALMLERKKRLVLCDPMDQKNEWEGRLFYKDAKTEDIYQLEIPELNDEDIVLYQEKLKAILPLHGKK